MKRLIILCVWLASCQSPGVKGPQAEPLINKQDEASRNIGFNYNRGSFLPDAEVLRFSDQIWDSPKVGKMYWRTFTNGEGEERLVTDAEAFVQEKRGNFYPGIVRRHTWGDKHHTARLMIYWVDKNNPSAQWQGGNSASGYYMNAVEETMRGRNDENNRALDLIFLGQ